MKRNQPFKRVMQTYCILLLGLTACAPSAASTVAPEVPTLPPELPQQETATPTALPVEDTVIVAFVKDGDIQVWDSTTGQSETVFRSGDVTALTVSGDGEVIAFVRSSWVGELDGYGQSALWAVDRNGDNPRQLVSAEKFRQRLHPREGETSSLAQMEWIPGTHRLLFSGWTYYIQGEGESHATPTGLYLVDADTLTETVLIAAGNGLQFVPSPDHNQVAVISLDNIGFINVDGSNPRSNVLTFPVWQSTAPIFPKGAWTQDAKAFVLAAPIESGEEYVWNFNIWRVPADGSPVLSLATITKNTYPDSINFSPGGSEAAFHGLLGEQTEEYGWQVVPLTAGVGPLAISRVYRDLWTGLHWSPADVAFTAIDGQLSQLCPNAAQVTEVCGNPVKLGGEIAAIHWLDGSRFLFLIGDSSELFMGSLDGTRVHIVTTPLESGYGPQRFSAVLKLPG